MSELVSLNKFTLGVDGVWRAGNSAEPFDYSDGEDAEQALHRILSSSEDLSSSSSELDAQIVDWPTEYHLSSARANLIKPLQFAPKQADAPIRILELGCGCGSITRYLAEQKGTEVDAIEGSSIRAGLAALRCRDLDNVTVCAANFNDLEFPQARYDAVLLIGVCEYAGRFSEHKDDRQATINLLKKAKKALKFDGQLVVAIENRLGLKYLFGANEDHYAQAFVGLDGYLNSSGIRTYSHQQWQVIISEAGFTDSHILLPFPDYKIPNAIISPDLDADQVLSSLADSQSRDYVNPEYALSNNEARAWQGLAQSGCLHQHANSFLIVLANNSDALQAIKEFSAQTYSTTPHSYLQASKKLALPSDTKVVNRLQAEITQLRGHSSNLEGKVSIMQNSIGWRVLNFVRRLFRRTTI